MLKKVINNFLIFSVLLLSFIATAQEGLPIYSDYLTENYYLIHPSMAGVSQCSQVRLTARKSWLGQEDAPGLQTIAYNGRISQRSGIGFNAFADQNGFHSQSGVYGTYAHHIMFSRDETDLNMLSFGLSAGFLQYRLDQSSFIVGTDRLVDGVNRNEVNFNMDIGMSYNLGNFFTHFTIKNLLENEGINNDAQVTSNLTNYMLSMGFVIQPRNRNVWFEPSVLIQHRPALNATIGDFNGKIYRQIKDKLLYLGFSYRNSFSNVTFEENNSIVEEQLKYISPFVGIKLSKLSFAYTYTQQLNSSVFQQSGFHQITIGYDFKCRKKRYHCNCPAINY